jgi:hypothetical protein
MHRFIVWMAACAAILVLSGCAAGGRICRQGANGNMLCVSGQGSTGQVGGYPQQGGQPVLIQSQPVYIQQPYQQYPQGIPPPVLFQQQIPPPTLFQQGPMPRTGPCVGYRLVPGVGYVCQGYQYGGVDDTDAAKEFGLVIAYVQIDGR